LKVPDLVTFDSVTESDVQEFVTSKSKQNHCEEIAAKSICPSNVEDNSADDKPNYLLFPCPEEGCVKTYQRFSALQLHMDCGKHQRSLEKETLYDKAVRGYSVRLDEQFGAVPQMQQFTTNETVLERPHLPMGWALKSTQTKRFTEKQKNYLSDKFRMGETTGQKANAASVAKAMMIARDSNGDRLFCSDEFLTSKQISSFFSRMSSKRTLPDEMTDLDNVKERNAAEKESAFNDLGNQIMEDVALVHPIFYDSYNLCELIASLKLAKFSIQMLQNICEYFDIPSQDIKSRRKAPYIERIVAFGKKCSCKCSNTAN